MNRTVDIKASMLNKVVSMVFDNNYSPTQAWRKYLKLSEVKVANKIGTNQSAYSKYEKSQKLRKATLIKIAEALQIKPELINF
ncbi:helix-turn-helix domain-containing protein [Gilliamella sp. Pas-s95]|uniref:helix-turn-helix domain-containing protein n=1 Tax=Gilliamella sp. Pas-s95 TaxID=2687317 RepID=UPI0013261F46|nr:helix-turn-helix transcriptional regulator [Gilliamella sp. Pas-s95]MWN06513.1 helix-turn-helix domain-containing protein [Gilliamella sp. Pas-s95]